MESGDRAVDNMKITPYQSLTGLTNFDLHLKCEVVNGIITMGLAYSTKLFKPSTAQKIKHRYLEILNQVVNNHEIKLKDITVSHDLVQSTSTLLQDNEGDFVF
jgi:tyrocidine synthetase-3